MFPPPIDTFPSKHCVCSELQFLIDRAAASLSYWMIVTMRVWLHNLWCVFNSAVSYSMYWCVNLSASLLCTKVCAMCIVAGARVFTAAVGNALLGLHGDSLLAMHEGTGRHAPVTSLWPQNNTLILLHLNQHAVQNILMTWRNTKTQCVSHYSVKLCICDGKNQL